MLWNLSSRHLTSVGLERIEWASYCPCLRAVEAKSNVVREDPARRIRSPTTAAPLTVVRGYSFIESAGVSLGPVLYLRDSADPCPRYHGSSLVQWSDPVLALLCTAKVLDIRRDVELAG